MYYSLFLFCVHFFTRRLLSLEMMIQYALVRVCIIYLLSSSSSLQTYYYYSEEEEEEDEEEEEPKEPNRFFQQVVLPFFSLGMSRNGCEFAVQI